MNAASLNEIKRELTALDGVALRDLCVRLARFKKENKELLSYLLFESHDEASFVNAVKGEIDEQFHSVPIGANSYFVKKSLRKILRIVNRQIRYSGKPETEVECRLHFCGKMREAKIPLHAGTVLFNLYQQQLKKIHAIAGKLPEDLQADYAREIEAVSKMK